MAQKKITTQKAKTVTPKKATTKKVAPKKVTAPKKDYAKMALALHKKLKGKLEVVSKGRLVTRDEWSTMY